MSSSGDRDPALLGVASTVVNLANPAAGADWVNAPGAGKNLLVVRARLVTSATVANRLPQLQIVSGVNALWVSPALPAQTAGLTLDYFWYPGAPTSTAVSGQMYAPMPTVPLGAGWTVGTSTAGLQAGDQWSFLLLTMAG